MAKAAATLPHQGVASQAGFAALILQAPRVSPRAMADMQGAVLALALLRRPVECWARDQAQDPRERELMSALPSVSGSSNAAGNETYDVVVVGAGFAGMYMLHRLR